MAVINGPDYITPTLDLNFAKSKNLKDSISGRELITYTRNSIGTYVGPDGLIKYAVANEPRFDHDPLTGVCNGLLIEEQRTNLVTYSVGPTEWSNAGGTTTISNAGSLIRSPADSTDVIISTPVSDFVNRNAVVLYTIAQPTTNTTYTCSCFIKKKDLRYATFTIAQSAWAYWQLAIDLNTGQLVQSSTFAGPPTNTNYSIQSYSNGWYRVSATMNLINTGGTTSVNIGFTDKSSNFFGSGGQALYVADGISGGYIWGAQVEVGSFPTSYIPTSGSQVTRSADVASITGTNFSSWYNQKESTVVLEYKLNVGLISGVYLELFGFNLNGGFSGYVGGRIDQGGSIRTWSQNDNIAYTSSLGVGNYKSSHTIVENTSTNKSISVCVNGSSVSETIVSANSSVHNTLSIGKMYANTSLCNPISRLTYYPQRLPNTQLQVMTR